MLRFEIRKDELLLICFTSILLQRKTAAPAAAVFSVFVDSCHCSFFDAEECAAA